VIKTITAANVNGALLDALWWLKVQGVCTSSRNGDVLASPFPVVTTYLRPQERVLFSKQRDANPFFHLMEAIWMLGGDNDVAFPSRYAKQIAEYSDDGLVLNGAYGYRWRHHFGIDQVRAIIDMLRKDRTTRRAVLSMWDASEDPTSAAHGSKDVPCNTHAYFTAHRGVLDMTVCCRSNDAIWGCYGANAVHFSMLLQLVAEASGISIGAYTQFSNNLHIYLGRKDVERLLAPNRDVLYRPDDLYRVADIGTVALIGAGETYEEFMRDVWHFLDDPDGDVVYETSFFEHTVAPMQVAHTAYKSGDMLAARSAMDGVHAMDWQIAGLEWLHRRAGGQP
jgi:hypothetical protein